MGIIRRWNRKLQKEEKYVNIFGRFFWSSLILAIGWGMLWHSDIQYSSQHGWVPNKGSAESSIGEGNVEGKPTQVFQNNNTGYSVIEDSLLLVRNRANNAEQIIINKSYVTSYNKNTRNPNWVSWKLTAEHSDGVYSRNAESFYEDERINPIRSTPQDYRGSGYDRGHMCPAADNRWNRDAMHESFAMTNVCPQDKDLNQNTWNEIEQLCRIWSRQYSIIYIVCGPLYVKNETRRIGENKVAVPSAFFKVVLRMGENPLGIGFICDNMSDRNTEVVHVTTIRMIENISKYIFFENLPDSIVRQVKDNSQIGRWYGTKKFVKQHNLQL